MEYFSIEPPDKLKHLIESFALFTNQRPNKQEYTILPDGLFDIVLFLDLNFKVKDVRIYGIYNQQVEVEIPPFTHVIVISFYPLAAEYIFQISIAKHFNSFSNASFLSNFFNSLEYSSLQTLVNEFVSKCDLQAMKTDLRKIKLFDIIFNSHGQLSVEEISEQLSWSRRQIHRYFQNRFGLSLKAYVNIIRCAGTYNDIKQGHLYPEINFSDQSHFIKEVKKHTGHKPKDLFQNKNDRFLQFLLPAGK